MKKYIVQDGDSMWKISKATGVRLNLLMAANPQVRDPNQLQPGMVLSIPELGKDKSTTPPTTVGGTPSSAGAAAPKTPSPAQQTPAPTAGEVPHGVSGMGPVSGEMPTAPGTVPYFGFVWPHVVKQGETWHSIADLYHVPVENLKRMNPRQSTQLSPGDIVYVPGTAGQVPGSTGSAGAGHVPAGHMPAGQGIDPGYGAGPDQMGHPGGWPPHMPGQHPGAGYPGWPYGAGVPPIAPGAGAPMQGYGPYGVPHWPGDMGVGSGGMPVAPDSYGPHTHVPYRPYRPYPAGGMRAMRPHPAYFPMAPYGYGGWWAGPGYPAPYGSLPADAGYRKWAASHDVPASWMRDWDESSAMESSWSSTFPAEPSYRADASWQGSGGNPSWGYPQPPQTGEPPYRPESST